MRVWHKTRTPTPSAAVRQVDVSQGRHFQFATHGRNTLDHGPELVLALNEAPSMIHSCCSGDFAEPISLSERFTSFGSGNVDKNGSRSTSRQRPRLMTPVPISIRTEVSGEITVPVSDILVLDVCGGSNEHQCNITTSLRVHYELTMENQNGQDMLEAFLRARLPKDRVVEAISKRTGSQLSKHSGSTTARSFDVEAFTAVRMAERMENETMSEKLRRKVVKVFSSIEESESWQNTKSVQCKQERSNTILYIAVSVALSECTCGCTKDHVSEGPPLLGEKRDSPPPPSERLGADRGGGTQRTIHYLSEETVERQGLYKDCQLPSGLSVEHEDGPELETTAH